MVLPKDWFAQEVIYFNSKQRVDEIQNVYFSKKLIIIDSIVYTRNIIMIFILCYDFIFLFQVWSTMHMLQLKDAYGCVVICNYIGLTTLIGLSTLFWTYVFMTIASDYVTLAHCHKLQDLAKWCSFPHFPQIQILWWQCWTNL